ncbi:PREDICTED: uncharacterized protein LOC108360978 [Rhagoletis zephyria]|uniref:uncharacterized protein LOC108360978 n=1 Tax=Rhagoletis zephyria TaxID=28612 RepID=UPI0008114297|nr:PREDICTED: uncharacterized protein LOC108360978 [Rhagoletis zephyria]
MWAIAKAIELAVEDKLEKIVIFTDSLTSCHLVEKNESNNYLAAKIHKSLNSSNLVCEIVWVPGHVGIEINEIADDLAKWAVNVGAPLKVKLTPEEALRQINVSIKDEWNMQYKRISHEKGKRFAEFFPEIPNKPWYHNSTLNAREIKTINRLLTGHTYDNVYLNRIRVVSTNICEECNIIDDYTHMIFACHKYSSIRNKYDAVKNHNDCTDILKKRDPTTLKDLCNFIKEAELEI